MAALLLGVIAVFSNLYTTQPLLPLFSQLFNVPPATATAFDNAGGAPGSAASFYLLWYYLGATVSPTLTGLAWQARGWSGVLVLCLGVLGVALGALVTLCR